MSVHSPPGSYNPVVCSQDDYKQPIAVFTQQTHAILQHKSHAEKILPCWCTWEVPDSEGKVGGIEGIVANGNTVLSTAHSSKSYPWAQGTL